MVSPPQRTLWALLALACLGWASGAGAHPVPSDNHDRTLVVRISPGAVVVDYRLELDELRAVLDLPREELARVTAPGQLPDVFATFFADVLANNLVASLDGQPLDFRCVGHVQQKTDHLRCDFRFEAPWKPAAGGGHRFAFRESNYEQDDFSKLQLTLAGDAGLSLASVTAPDEALRERPAADRKPGDGERLRQAAATFTVEPTDRLGEYKPGLTPDVEARPPAPGMPGATVKTNPPPAPGQVKPPPREGDKVAFLKDVEGGEPASVMPPPASREMGTAAPGNPTLLNLLLDTRQGLGVLLLLAAGFGAVHALTPGHGKTLAAAYLVGERGTVGHALLLGLVTTLTHTSAVLVLAALLPRFFPQAVPAAVQAVLGLVGGFLVAGLGFWLLLCRLAGRADHVHLGGHHHHHHGHPHSHHEGEARPVGAWGLVLLGINGGIIPCWDALAMLVVAVSAQRLWLGLPLLLAFSAGLAAVLVAIGIAVVYARNAVSARWGTGPRFRAFLRALPLVSALLITALGLWLCHDSLQAVKGMRF